MTQTLLLKLLPFPSRPQDVEFSYEFSSNMEPWDTLRYLEFLGAGNNSLFVFLPLTFASPVSGMPGENPLLFFDWFPRVPPSRITGFFGEPWVSLKKKTTLPPPIFHGLSFFLDVKVPFLGGIQYITTNCRQSFINSQLLQPHLAPQPCTVPFCIAMVAPSTLAAHLVGPPQPDGRSCCKTLADPDCTLRMHNSLTLW